MDLKIIIDTREQLPLLPPKGYKYIFKKLDAGDYSVYGAVKQFAIERKSIADLFNTLANKKNFARFEKELAKLQKLCAYLLIEGTAEDIMYGSHFSSANGYLILEKLFLLTKKYNIHVVFAGRREIAGTVLLAICRSFAQNRNVPRIS